MTNESSITDFTLPIASVVCYSPNGLPTTAVNCFNLGAILYAVEHANPADSIHVKGYKADRASRLACQWTKDCQSSVTHLDRKGYIYCEHHARQSGRGRKLTSKELTSLRAGETVGAY